MIEAATAAAAAGESAGQTEWQAVPREDLCALARLALAAYGLQRAAIQLLEKKTNVTFRVEAPTAAPAGGGGEGVERFLLRICQPGSYSREEIQSEIAWLLALRRQAELLVPEPVAAGDGSLLTFAASPALPEPRPCVLFHWLPGTMLEGAVTPSLIEQVGELAARMHRCAETFTPPAGFSRPRWDCDRLLGAGAVIPAGQGEPLIDRRARELLDRAAAVVRADVTALGEGREMFGLIHKDFEPDNTVVHAGQVYAIDFADCGWGYFLYDIAASLLPLREQAGFAALRAAFLRGYRRVRPLPPEHEALLETFFIARSLFSIRLMAQKTYAERPEIRDYAHRVVPLMLGEIRRFVERRDGGAATAPGAPLSRATTVQLLARLRSLGVQLWVEGDRLRFRAPAGALAAELRAELGERRAELLAFLRQGYLAARASAPATAAAAHAGRAPLSFAQLRLWFLDQLLPGSAEYNVARSMLLTGAVRVPVLRRSFDEVVRRHSVLRTRFESAAAEPEQVVGPALALPLPEVDLRALPAGAPEREAQRLAGAFARRPFDLQRGPLLRVLLLRLGGERWMLTSTLHHIVSDGWSIGLLFREMALLYQAFSAGLPSPLPELKLQYADFAVWQRQYLGGEVLAEQLDYWRRQFAGAAQAIELPADRPRPAVRSGRGGKLRLAVPPEVAAGLHAMAQAAGATLFMALAAAWTALLHRLCGQDDILLGFPIANRNRAEIEPLIGFFVNTLVLRARLAGDPSGGEHLLRVKEATLGAYAHQDLPFEKLVEELQPRRDLAINPLFQVMLALQNAARQPVELAGLAMEPLPTPGGSAQFDLSLSLQETGAAIDGALEYAADLFDPTTAHRWARQFATLLRAFARHAAPRLSELQILDDAEAHQLCREWNDTAAAWPADVCLHQLFERQVDRAPGAVAVAGDDADGREGGDVTYRQLDRWANQIAHCLLRAGAGPETVVAVCVERSPEMVAGLLGVLKAGACYLPLDPDYPRQRLAFLIEDAQAPLLLTQRRLLDRLPASGARVIFLDSPATEIAAHGTARPAPAGRPDPDNLAYVIYTSGSTGSPKGVMVPHRGLLNRIAWAARAYPVTAADRILQKASFSFDFSVWECFAPLLAGARLVLAAPGGQRDPAYLARRIAEQGVTLVHFVPSMLPSFLAAPGLERCDALRFVFAGGETLPPDTVRQFYRRFGLDGPRLRNQYGPTEITIDLADWVCPPDPAPQRSVPIGRPLANTAVQLLDAALRPVPIGVAGELCLGGAGVTRGYLRRPDLTAERFVPDPCGPPGARLYRSGDRGRRLPDGTLEFLGRFDHQVKVRGFRIEPGEIESALARHPAVREAAVAALPEPATGQLRLVAYLVLHEPPGNPAPPPDLRAWLRGFLPEHMMPAAFVVLPELPLSPAGKLDRRALPPPEAAAAAGLAAAFEAAGEPPATPAEELLAALWCEVLGRPGVGVLDDFFDLGGHSLLATQVVSRVRGAFGVELPLRDLFTTPTVRALAARLDELRRAGDPALTASGERPPLAPLARAAGEPLPLSFAQQRLWFLDQLAPGGTAYHIVAAVRLRGTLHVPALAAALAGVVARHEVLRTTFPALGGQPVQRIAGRLATPLPRLDLAALPPSRREPQARALAAAAAERPFDLAAGPLLRALLLRLDEHEHIAVLALHHIVADGWSIGVLLRELAALYRPPAAAGAAPGTAADLPPLPVQYADFSAWQRRWLAGDVLEAELDYWRRQLAGAPAMLELPSDRPRPAVPSQRGAVRRLALAPELALALPALARRRGATLFMTLLAAFQALLGRLTGQRDLVVGAPVAGRNHRATEPLIGCFVNTLVLRADLGAAPGFGELLSQVRLTALDAYAHQDLPFELLVEALHPERDLARNPLFQVAFALQNAPLPELALRGLVLAPLAESAATAKFDLSLVLAEAASGPPLLAGTIEYACELFDAATVERLAGQLRTLLSAVAADPDRRLGDLPWLDAAQSHQLRCEWNDTSPVGAADATDAAGCIHPLVLARAAATPDATAVVDAEGTMTYGELAARAGQLARHLRTLGAGPETVIAVCMRRSAAEVTALLAVLAAGGAYLPLDPAHPAARQRLALADAGVRLLLRGAGVELEPPAGVRSLDLAPGSADWQAIRRQPAPAPLDPAPSASLAYVIYTSGTTGRPKGVQVEHRQLLQLVAWHRRAFALSPSCRATRLASPAFDASVWEIWPYLAAGASVHVPDPETAVSAPALRAWLLARAITHAFLPTPLAEEILGLGWPAAAPLGELLTGGDLLHQAPPAGLPFRLVNNYGPTETTVVATSGPVAGAGRAVTAAAERPPSIGRPIDGARVYLLDAALLPQPTGVPGEIHVGGAGVGRGYRGAASLTAERFLPDPFAGRGGARMYRTGDTGRYLADGRIEFLGRRDRQVKVRGVRIELGEIEATLAAHPGVLECAVVTHETGAAGRRLVAYVAAAPSGPPLAVADLAALARRRLPAARAPAAFVLLDRLPVTASGKVDRDALPAPPLQEPRGAAPRDTVELALVQIWEELLGAAPIGVEDEFFSLGGHSLLAVRLIARIQARFGRGLPLAALFQNGTVEGLARLLRQGAPLPPASPLVPIQPAGRRPALVCVHPVGGGVLCYLDLARRLGSDQPLYGLQGGVDQAPGAERPRSIEAIAAGYLRQLEELREPRELRDRTRPRDLRATPQVEGQRQAAPYSLAGWSFGGVVAFEMACQLAAAGQPPMGLLLLDSHVPPAGGGAGASPAQLLSAFAGDLLGLAPGGPPGAAHDLAGDLAALDGGDGEPAATGGAAPQPASAALARLYERARGTGLLPPDLELAQLAERFATFRTHVEALQGYRPRPYAGRVTLLRTALAEAPDQGGDPLLGWGAFAGAGVAVHEVAGDHYSMLRTPHVEALARRIAEELSPAAGAPSRTGD